MPVQVIHHFPPAGGVQIAQGQFVAFSLEPEPMPGGANATFVFVCEHRDDPPLLDIDNRLPVYHWYVGSPPPPTLPDANHYFPPDSGPGQPDNYTIGLLFPHCPAYRLRITLFPQNQPLMDSVFRAQSVQDREGVIFTVGT
jgi:hypothetical protein